MASISTTTTYWRSGGVPVIQQCIGYESGPKRTQIARYQFTSPSTGASSVSWYSQYCSLTDLHQDGAWSFVNDFNWIITTDPDGYKYYIGDDGFNVSGEGGVKFSGSANVNLLPNTTYYLFVYPDNNFTNHYAIFRIGDISLTVSGVFGISSVVATNANIGSTSTITINRNSSTFTHTLQYKVSGQSSFTTIVSKTSAVSYSWTVPQTVYNYLGSTAKNITITIKCITYNGSITLGEKTTTITAYAVENDCKPTVSANYTLLNDYSNLTGDNTTAILQASNVRFTISAIGKNGASITSYSIINGGNTYNVSSVDFTPLQSAGFTYRVTDSRGYTTEGTLTITSINYFKPTISLTVTPPDTQTNITKVKGNGKIYQGSFGAVNNTLTVYYRYKETGGSYSSWQSLTATITSNNYKTEEKSFSLDYRKKYVFQGKVVDKINQVLTEEIPVVSLPVFDWSKDDFHLNVPLIIGDTTLTEQMVQNISNIPNVKFQKGLLPANTATTISLPVYEFGVIFTMSAASTKCSVIVYRSRSNGNITPLILGNPTDLTITPGEKQITIKPSSGAETAYIKMSY